MLLLVWISFFIFFPLYSKFHHSQLCNSYNYSLIYIHIHIHISWCSRPKWQGTQVYNSSSSPPKTSRSRMGRTTEAAQPSLVESWNMVKAAWKGVVSFPLLWTIGIWVRKMGMFDLWPWKFGIQLILDYGNTCIYLDLTVDRDWTATRNIWICQGKWWFNQHQMT